VKITFVLPFVNLTGGVRVMLDYADWLHGAGHDVAVVYPAWPYRFHWTQRDRWVEYRKQMVAGVRVPWTDLKCRLMRVPLIRTGFLPRADVVVATAWPTALDVARLHSSRGRKVHVVMHHEGGTGPEHRIQAIYRKPFHRITFSRTIGDSLERQFACAVNDIVPGAIDPAKFYRDGHPEPDSVLMLYHPDPRKGGDDGLLALRRLQARMPRVRVRLMGTVRPAACCRQPFPFEFHPGDETLRHAYSTATAFLYPSRYEGFGLPPLEAMACGCPVVTTAVGAVTEYACDRRNALVVPVGDVDAMADRLEDVLTDAGLRQRLVGEGMTTADAFGVGKVAPLFAAALKRAVLSPP
jgi:glycosyltransferase involved in cell wall biosynthesis